MPRATGEIEHAAWPDEYVQIKLVDARPIRLEMKRRVHVRPRVRPHLDPRDVRHRSLGDAAGQVHRQFRVPRPDHHLVVQQQTHIMDFHNRIPQKFFGSLVNHSIVNLISSTPSIMYIKAAASAGILPLPNESSPSLTALALPFNACCNSCLSCAVAFACMSARSTSSPIPHLTARGKRSRRFAGTCWGSSCGRAEVPLARLEGALIS